MASWRGRRFATWVTGALAFLASVATGFTGYLIQFDFDSQWIATQAKDGLNSAGIGSFFNTLNTGQAILLHVALLPLVVGIIAVWHVILVRRRGVVPPLDAQEIVGGAISAIFSSPDEPAVTLQQWAKQAPADFVATTTGELAGTTISASYGPPYNNAGEGLKLGPLKIQKWAGITIPVNPAVDFVVDPLKFSTDVAVPAALSQWNGASTEQQTKWATDYAAAIEKAGGDYTKVATSNAYGPVPAMGAGLLGLAQSNVLDGLLTTTVTPYPSDFTKPMLFLADGGYFDELGAAQHLHGDQWGMMNETGSYPGQSWLWLFSLWYQVEPFKSSENADIQIFALLMILTLGFIFMPKIPFINRLPRLIPIHRLI